MNGSGCVTKVAEGGGGLRIWRVPCALRHAGLDPASTFFPCGGDKKEGGPRIKSGVTVGGASETVSERTARGEDFRSLALRSDPPRRIVLRQEEFTVSRAPLPMRSTRIALSQCDGRVRPQRRMPKPSPVLRPEHCGLGSGYMPRAGVPQPSLGRRRLKLVMPDLIRHPPSFPAAVTRKKMDAGSSPG
jgi:hypothetical protein